MKSVLLAAFAVCILGILAVDAPARPQYKSVIDDLKPDNDAEKEVQAAVKKDKCNHCHGKKSKKIRTEYGMKLHTALGKGDKDDYKFDKKLWKKGDDGEYSEKAIKLLRDAIEKAAKEDDDE